MGTNRHAPTGWLTALVLTLLAAGCSATHHPLGTDPRLASPPTSALQAAQGPPTPPDLPPGLVADPAAFAGQGRLVFSYQGRTYLIDGLRRMLEALPGGSVLSPDGQWVAWRVPNEGGSQLWVRRLGNGGPAQLTGLPPGKFAWSPDSKMLAVAFGGSVTVGGPGMQVHTLMSLQATEEITTIAWSPTSARVAAASAHELWVGGPGSDTEQVAQAPEGLDLAGWSPDGQTLAYVLTLPSKDPPISSTELDTVPAGGGTPVRRYVSEEARILFAGWWPDGGGIVFWDDPMGSASLLADGVGLLSLSLAGGAPRPLGTALSYPDWISWVGGDQIVFVVASGRESWTTKSLEACDAAKATCRAIPQPAGKVSVDPAWSAASNQVTFVRADELRGADGTDSETGGPAWVATRALWVASPDGSGQRELTAAGRGVFGPSWSRDGRHLLYLRDGALWLMDTISGTAARIVTLKLDPTAYFYDHINWQEQATWWKG